MGDLIHKTISPKTYQCSLCGLTYSEISMKNDWKEFINLLPFKIEFLYKDEFLKQYPGKQNLTFPSAYIIENGSLTELISTQEINQQKNLNELKALVNNKVSNL